MYDYVSLAAYFNAVPMLSSSIYSVVCMYKLVNKLKSTYVRFDLFRYVTVS